MSYSGRLAPHDPASSDSLNKLFRLPVRMRRRVRAAEFLGPVIDTGRAATVLESCRSLPSSGKICSRRAQGMNDEKD
jgi:hypothetical protein